MRRCEPAGMSGCWRGPPWDRHAADECRAGRAGYAGDGGRSGGSAAPAGALGRRRLAAAVAAAAVPEAASAAAAGKTCGTSPAASHDIPPRLAPPPLRRRTARPAACPGAAEHGSRGLAPPPVNRRAPTGRRKPMDSREQPAAWGPASGDDVRPCCQASAAKDAALATRRPARPLHSCDQFTDPPPARPPPRYLPCGKGWEGMGWDGMGGSRPRLERAECDPDRRTGARCEQPTANCKEPRPVSAQTA